MSRVAADRFESAYTRSLLPAAAAKLSARRAIRGQAGVAPSQAWALGGAVILPGLIDLHGHPEWNVFAAWEPPRLYPNRAAWRSSAECAAVITRPMSALTKDFTDKEFLAVLARYAEIRALVGGTTAIQGSSGEYPTAPQALVRHLDLAPFGDANAAALIDPLSPSKAADRTKIITGMSNGTITAFYAHLAEGVDAASRDEFKAFDELNLLTEATVVIHGTALAPRQLGAMREIGAKLVWSPQSNLRLYGKTTAAATALKLGLPLGLGADWLPSGSVGLLAELQVARRVLAAQGARLDAATLVEVVTQRAAEIAGLAARLGQIAVGRPADLLVLERLHDDPFESVCRSERGSVELVAIGGHLLYGRDDWFAALEPAKAQAGATGETVWAWGRKMRLDVAAADDPTGHHPPLPGLQATRAQILARYLRAGPIFA